MTGVPVATAVSSAAWPLTLLQARASACRMTPVSAWAADASSIVGWVPSCMLSRMVLLTRFGLGMVMVRRRRSALRSLAVRVLTRAVLRVRWAGRVKVRTVATSGPR